MVSSAVLSTIVENLSNGNLKVSVDNDKLDVILDIIKDMSNEDALKLLAEVAEAKITTATEGTDKEGNTTLEITEIDTDAIKSFTSSIKDYKGITEELRKGIESDANKAKKEKAKKIKDANIAKLMSETAIKVGDYVTWIDSTKIRRYGKIAKKCAKSFTIFVEDCFKKEGATSSTMRPDPTTLTIVSADDYKSAVEAKKNPTVA